MEENSEEKVEENSGNKIEGIKTRLKENPWIVSTAVLGLIALILVIMILKPGLTGNVIAEADAGNKLIEFAKTQGISLEVISVIDKGSYYEVEAKMNGQRSSFPVTKDGNFLLSGVIPITGNAVSDTQQTTETPAEIVKSDKPKVELFVMTYCPYGTQAEKGLIPVLKLLNDKIDGKIRFVHYFMHGDKEEAETYNQVCIREEQSAKYIDYLACFLEDGDSSRCVTKIGIDKSKLTSCLSSKAKDYYAEDSALSQQYSVQGSPTLVINEVEASSARSPEAFLTTICSAFNTSPEDCSEQLSDESPSPGFGYSAPSTDNSGGSCG